MDRIKQIDRLLMNMAIVFDKDLNEPQVDLYHELLAGYEVDEIKAAAFVVMKKSKFFPRPAEIIEVMDKNRGPQLSIESRSQAEWRKVLTAVRQRGRSAGPPKFENNVTAHLVATQFNWIHLNEMREDNENWYEKRWCEAFALASEIDLNQLAIDMAGKVKKLAQGIGDIDENN